MLNAVLQSHFLKVPELPFHSLISILAKFPADIDSRVFWSSALRDMLYGTCPSAISYTTFTDCLSSNKTLHLVSTFIPFLVYFLSDVNVLQPLSKFCSLEFMALPVLAIPSSSPSCSILL